MGPKGKHPLTGDLFQQPLVELINLKHPLVKLADLIDWSIFETRWSAFFPSKTGRPATPPRLVAGLLYLQHTFACSDEELIRSWVEPVLATVLWRDLLSTRTADRPVVADTLASACG